jgi:Family of unknown function (DUF6502)
MDNPSPNPVAPPASLISAIRRLLAPLARLLLAYGITYPFLAELLKSVLVEVAARDFRLDNKRLTQSRITVLTGVHRGDVKRLSGSQPIDTGLSDAVSLAARIVTRWTSQPEYLDRKKRPVALARLAADGGGRSFEALVASVSKNIRARSVLDELLRLGIARLDQQDRVCLNAGAFIPERSFDEKAYYLGQNIHDHIAAAAHNMLAQTPPFLERNLVFEKLTPRSAEELHRLAIKLGMQALRTVYRRARELEKQDALAPDNSVQISYGAFFFSAPGDKSGETGNDRASARARGSK